MRRWPATDSSDEGEEAGGDREISPIVSAIADPGAGRTRTSLAAIRKYLARSRLRDTSNRWRGGAGSVGTSAVAKHS
jgi:hypothetical protein